MKGNKKHMTNNYDYIYCFYLKNAPIGTHNATIVEVKNSFNDDCTKQYIQVTWFIDTLDKCFTYCFRKSNSFLSKHVRFLNMLKKATNHPFSSIGDLIGESFAITIAVSPHYDEKENSYLKITDIKPVKEVK